MASFLDDSLDLFATIEGLRRAFFAGDDSAVVTEDTTSRRFVEAEQRERLVGGSGIFEEYPQDTRHVHDQSFNTGQPARAMARAVLDLVDAFRVHSGRGRVRRDPHLPPMVSRCAGSRRAVSLTQAAAQVTEGQ